MNQPSWSQHPEGQPDDRPFHGHGPQKERKQGSGWSPGRWAEAGPHLLLLSLRRKL